MPYWRNSADRTKPEFDVIFPVTFDTLFRRLRVVLWQKLKQFLKLYEWQSVYITFFGPTMHWGLFKGPYILSSLTYWLKFTVGFKAYFCQFLVSNVIIFFFQHIFKKVKISLDCVHRANNRCNIWIHWFPSCFFVFLSSLYH